MYDTHCHLNFSRFKKNVDEVIKRAHDAGVTSIIIPGTDIESSRKAIEIAEKNSGIYAAVGIHPHHAIQITHDELQIANIQEIEKLLINSKVVAVGEVGLDKHIYTETKYESYHITSEFLEKQKELLLEQLKLAIKYNKSVILHNREAADDLLELLTINWNKYFEGRMVFHCCEPDEKLLKFVKEHNVFIGVDGDITYDIDKQEFIKHVPLERLVVETDSPFLLPEPLKARHESPNEPKNIPLILKFISHVLTISEDTIAHITTDNAKSLFQFSST